MHFLILLVVFSWGHNFVLGTNIENDFVWWQHCIALKTEIGDAKLPWGSLVEQSKLELPGSYSLLMFFVAFVFIVLWLVRASCYVAISNKLLTWFAFCSSIAGQSTQLILTCVKTTQMQQHANWSLKSWETDLCLLHLHAWIFRTSSHQYLTTIN